MDAAKQRIRAAAARKNEVKLAMELEEGNSSVPNSSVKFQKENLKEMTTVRQRRPPSPLVTPPRRGSRPLSQVMVQAKGS